LQGLHPRILTEGFELAKDKALEALELAKIPVESKRDVLVQVARTSLRTKVHQQLADLLTEACVDAVLAIKEDG
jgi:T-complex protein 1 subunit zeta